MDIRMGQPDLKDHACKGKRTRGTETSQYLEEEKSKEIPLVAASEGGRAQTDPNTKQTAVN